MMPEIPQVPAAPGPLGFFFFFTSFIYSLILPFFNSLHVNIHQFDEDQDVNNKPHTLNPAQHPPLLQNKTPNVLADSRPTEGGGGVFPDKCLLLDESQ